TFAGSCATAKSIEMSSNLESFAESDPAAEFLAREQDALQGLEDEFNFVNENSHFETLNGDVKENHNEDLNGESDEASSDINIMKAAQSQPAYEVKEVKEEPETIRKWREEHQRLLEEKDKEEAKRKDELRESAQKELEEWYLRYSEQLEKSKNSNRLAEKEWIAERDAESPGLEWEKIARMCDFNPKSSRNQRDTSRMRSILLQLKQSPPSTS
ncbi:Clathrin light chain A-like protein, partial [Leptotrombidium deliense]